MLLFVAVHWWGSRASRAIAYYCLVGLVTAVIFGLVVPFGPWPFRVPFSYSGDGVVLTLLVKATAEDGPLHFSHLGAPFGADFVDWGFGGWLIFLVTTPLYALLGHAGAAINAYWIVTVVGAAVSAAWAFRRVAIPPPVALAFGVLYALLPGTFLRNVGHIALAHTFVPLLCLLCLRVAGTRPDRSSRAERWVTLGACVLQGLSLVYYAFFACVLLAAAIPIGFLRTRRPALVRTGLLGLLLLTLGSAIPLVPSFAYWSRHGRNERLAYKTVADADSFGLKLRHLLLPIDEHPLGAFRAVASRASAAAFPGENENTTAHLGLLGALGLLSLLGLAVARTAGAMPLGDDDLDAPAALTVVTLLVAQVGGLGSIFNLLVAPDVRAYNRMSTFIAWFALLATAALVTRALGRIGGEGRVGGASVVGALVLLALGVADQVPMASLRSIRGASAPDFAEVETFVERVEGLLPRGAMVFQLPHGTLPVDTPRPPLGLYDSGRPYLSSKTLRWSFGSIVGRTDHWYRDTVRLAPAEMAQRLALAGFAGIWIDRAAYRGANHPRADLYVRLAEVAGVRPESSSGGRYCFISLEGVRHRLQLERGEQGAEEASGASAP